MNNIKTVNEFFCRQKFSLFWFGGLPGPVKIGCSFRRRPSLYRVSVQFYFVLTILLHDSQTKSLEINTLLWQYILLFDRR